MGYKYFTVYIASADDFETADDMLAEIRAGNGAHISEYGVSFPDSTAVMDYEGEEGQVLLAETIAWGEASFDWQRDKTLTITCLVTFGADGEIVSEEVMRVDVR